MGSVLGGLEAEAYDRSYSDADLIRRIVAYFGRQRRRVMIVTGTVIIVALLQLAEPLLISRTIEQLEANAPDSTIALLVGAVFFISVFGWVLNLIRRRAAGRTVQDMVLALRKDAFAAAMSRDMSFYDEFPSGGIVSRITSDTQEFAQVVVLVTDLLSQLIVLVVLLAILFSIEWRLAMILVVLMPMIIGAALGFRNIARRVTRQGRRVVASVNTTIQESISGIAVAKNFRQEGRIYEQFSVVNQQSYKINWRRGFVIALIFPVLNMLVGVGSGIMLYSGAVSVLAGTITLGAWLLFIRSLSNFWDPLTNISSFWSQFQSGLSAAERVFALIDAQPVVVQTDNQPVKEVRGEIEFERVRFQYSKQEVVLPEFSLHIQPGETVAFVGHTGAGKSSIAKLVARFYEFQGGTLRIDGRDIRTLNLEEYRRHLGIVSQVPFLFSGTVIDNIRYARPDATEAQIEAVAHKIGDGEWIETLPQGLHSDVGERGARLSMGQRQLVALTRVLVQEPSIFILDEATASIDPFTESQIQQALNLILANSTSILIAHRLSTVRSADRIVVLKKGDIIEQGNHDGLMQQGGHYAELYNTYFRHQSLDYLNTRPDERLGLEETAQTEVETGKR
jgi:ATP-binding cassette, subfamily B, bacterial